MTFRHRTEMQSSFLPVAALLDAKLEMCTLDGQTQIVDRSNRDAFDKSGFGQYSWVYEFSQREPFGSYISQATVTVAFVEPLVQEEPRRLSFRWCAEVFALGSQSWHRVEGIEHIEVSDLGALDLDSSISRLLRLAWEQQSPRLPPFAVQQK